MNHSDKKFIENLKAKFVSLYIDQICNDSDKLNELIDLSDRIRMNPISIRLFICLIMAYAEEDFFAVKGLKEEIIRFVDVRNNE